MRKFRRETPQWPRKRQTMIGQSRRDVRGNAFRDGLGA